MHCWAHPALERLQSIGLICAIKSAADRNDFWRYFHASAARDACLFPSGGGLPAQLCDSAFHCAPGIVRSGGIWPLPELGCRLAPLAPSGSNQPIDSRGMAVGGSGGSLLQAGDMAVSRAESGLMKEKTSRQSSILGGPAAGSIERIVASGAFMVLDVNQRSAISQVGGWHRRFCGRQRGGPEFRHLSTNTSRKDRQPEPSLS